VFGQLILAASDPAAQADALQPIKDFFFDSRMQYRADGSMLLDPRGDPLPDNLWTQYVAVQATLIERLDQSLRGIGISQSFGLAVCLYTLGIRTILYPIVKSQLETTAKIKVLTPRVNELKEEFKDDEERLNQEVGPPPSETLRCLERTSRFACSTCLRERAACPLVGPVSDASLTMAS